MSRYCCFFVLSTFAALPSLGADRESAAPIRLLIVDGMNNHDWPRATKILKEILETSGRLSVDVSTSPPGSASEEQWEAWRPEFSKYDVVLSNFNGGHKPSSRHWPRQLERELEDYVRGGGGLVIYHSANNSFPKWTAYNEMIGLGWRRKEFGPSVIVGPDEKIVLIPQGEGRNPGHGPEHDFQITVLTTDHPITKGLPKRWMYPHEQLTHGQHGPAKNMTILSYAHSKDTGDNEVMDWVIPYGKGRVYVTMLGHLWKNKSDVAMRCIGFQTTLIRGCQWAATGKVTYPVPREFPTADTMKLRVSAELDNRDTQIAELIHRGTTTLAIRSPRGIGNVTLKRTSWANVLKLRLYLRGMEGLTISNGSARLRVAVSSSTQNNSGSLQSVVIDGKERKVTTGDAYWAQVGIYDAGGNVLHRLPDKGGYFEVTVPKKLLEHAPEQLSISWIDFYR